MHFSLKGDRRSFEVIFMNRKGKEQVRSFPGEWGTVNEQTPEN